MNGDRDEQSRGARYTFKQGLVVFWLGIAVVLTGVGAAAAAAFVDGFGENSHSSQSLQEEISPASGVEISAHLSNRITFLLIGMDMRGDDPGLADSLVLVSAAPDTKIISLMSIPRDSEVLGHTKINAVVSLRGEEALVKLVSTITGAKIDGYVKTDFAGFKDIIDILGGIDIYVEKKMYYETGDKEDGYIDLEQGMQCLDGAKALQYARFRNDAFADITRTFRQQKVIMAITKKALRAENIGKLPQLIPQVTKAVETNLRYADILKLAGLAENFKSENMVSATLPGRFMTDREGISYWKIDERSAKKVTADLFKGISTNHVIL
ncbi:MAG: LCP family protein [Peptococcaceae bacterium]|nr:LCP family protein [Peptococcaceae bacterium]